MSKNLTPGKKPTNWDALFGLLIELAKHPEVPIEAVCEVHGVMEPNAFYRAMRRLRVSFNRAAEKAVGRSISDEEMRAFHDYCSQRSRLITKDEDITL